mgnify:CR=1 FL=1
MEEEDEGEEEVEEKEHVDDHRYLLKQIMEKVELLDLQKIVTKPSC